MKEIPFPVIDLTATGENIIRLREERGLKVKDLQRFFGFEGPQAIYKWQEGKCLPTVDNLYGLGVLFGVTMNDILVPVARTVTCERISCEQPEVTGCFCFAHFSVVRSVLFISAALSAPVHPYRQGKR